MQINKIAVNKKEKWDLNLKKKNCIKKKTKITIDWKMLIVFLFFFVI